MPIRTVIFDLGGVLVNLDGQPFRNEWLKNPLPHEDSWKLWLQSPVVRAFDRGQVDAIEFADTLIRDMDLAVDRDAFIAWIRDWPKEIFDGVFDILDALRGQVTLGVFSNITELHWPRYYEQLRAHGAVEYFFASYQMGLVKPEPEAFAHVIESIGRPPGEMLFIDDNRLNVDAAIVAGMHARQARGVRQVRTVLAGFGLL